MRATTTAPVTRQPAAAQRRGGIAQGGAGRHDVVDQQRRRRHVRPRAQREASARHEPLVPAAPALGGPGLAQDVGARSGPPERDAPREFARLVETALGRARGAW